MLDSIINIKGEVLEALGQTAFMVLTSLVFAIVLGGLLGLVLFVTSDQLFVKNAVINKIVGIILNIIRSVPFLILMIFLLPLSKLIVGTKIGSQAVIVPLSIASIAFFSRLAEASFSAVNRYQTEIMIVCVVILIVLVQLIQWIGDTIARIVDNK